MSEPILAAASFECGQSAMEPVIVTRHDGAACWLQARIGRSCRHIPHLAHHEIRAGQAYFGVFPLHLAAAICAAGSTCWSIVVDVPASLRGRELSASDLSRLGARLVPFQVAEVPVSFDAGGVDKGLFEHRFEAIAVSPSLGQAARCHGQHLRGGRQGVVRRRRG